MATPPPAGHRLAAETSPYLLSHASNPVAWYAWGEQAWQQARERDCPVLLSVGYAACHWCHVMERESFVDERIAAMLNEHFIAIKVDREERPDIDAVYMAATQALNGGRGGWPMTLLLTPSQQPFFAGTYLPPYDSKRQMGFATLLRRAADLWASDRRTVEQQAASIATAIADSHHARGERPISSLPPSDAAQQAAEATVSIVASSAESFDEQHGGFGPAPKFLATTQLQVLLRAGWQDDDRVARHLVSHTLWQMARGGLYDVLGGGFSRYSVDLAFRVPHFEKMLYDNALMLKTLTAAYSATRHAPWRHYALETLGFVGREMRNPEGAFVTAIDADSEGEEGRFYTWTHDEAMHALRPTLSEAEAAAWLQALGVSHAGNFEHGRNVLYAAQVRDQQGRPSAGEGAPPWATVQALLLRARDERVRPLTDDKVLLGHNGLMIGALSQAASVLREPVYLEWAQAAATFAWRRLRRPDGKMWRTWRAGRAQVLGMLEDYAYFADGLISAYEAGAGDEWLVRAESLVDTMLASFRCPKRGHLYDADEQQQVPMFRPSEGHDGATPSANAVAMGVLWRLSVHTGRTDLSAAADTLFAAWREAAETRPQLYATLWAARRDATRPRCEATWIGRGAPATSELWQAMGEVYLPELVRAHGQTHAETPAARPLLRGRTRPPSNGSKSDTLYICLGTQCFAPVQQAEEALDQLGVRRPA